MGATIRDARCRAAHLALSGDSSILDLRGRRCGVAALAPPDPAGLFHCRRLRKGRALIRASPNHDVLPRSHRPAAHKSGPRTPSAPHHKQAGFSRLGYVYEAKWKVSESSTTDMVLWEPDIFSARELRAAPISSSSCRVTR